MYLKNNNKFWSIDSDGKKVIIRFGKLAANGDEEGVEVVEKEFSSAHEAEDYVNESLALKFSKGYEEEGKSSKSKNK
jgi:predicted DNA-binding WGR domain protein